MAISASASSAQATILADPMGDGHYDAVHSGWDGSGNRLTDVLSGYRDPATGSLLPITHPSGRDLVVGDVDANEDPTLSDQTQWQRFVSLGEDAELTLTYLDEVSGYKNVMGIYHYAMDQDPAQATLTTQLLLSESDSRGTSVNFTVPKDHYFGFYLDANGGKKSKGTYFTENFRNSDNRDDHVTDHFLVLQSNMGLVLAMEDLAYKPSTGLMGDQDYQDMLVGMVSYADGTPLTPNAIPEPASMALLVAGGVLVFWRRGRGMGHV